MKHMFGVSLDSLFGNNYLVQWCILVLIVFIITFLLAGVLGRLQSRSLRRQAARRTTIIADYESFKELLPHELGYLYDDTFADNELFAVLLQLANKNALTIKDAKDDIYFEAKDIPKAQLAALSSAEQAVYGMILARPSKQVSWRPLSSNLAETNGPQAIFESSTLSDLAHKGYVDRRAKYQALKDHKLTVIITSLLATLAVLAAPYILAFGSLNPAGDEFEQVDRMLVRLLFVLLMAVLWPIIYLYCHLVAYNYFRAAGLPAGATELLRNRWPQIVGYRQYVKMVELNRLESDRNIQDESLPVCIAFGLYPSWLKHLKLDD